jgi:hypothetical protein
VRRNVDQSKVALTNADAITDKQKKLNVGDTRIKSANKRNNKQTFY